MPTHPPKAVPALGLPELEGIEGIELIQRLPIFSRLNFDETTRLGRICENVQVAEGAVVIEQDGLGEALYIVCGGWLSVTRKHLHKDDQETLGQLGPGDIFGEMALLDDLLTSARVVAATPCKLLKIPRAAFQGLLEGDERLALKVYRSFCRALSVRLRKVNDLLSGSQAFTMGVH